VALDAINARARAAPDCCSHAPPARRAMSVRRRLLPGHPRDVGKHWIARPRPMLSHWKQRCCTLDTDFELHRLSHDPDDAAVSRPTTRRVVVSPLRERGLAGSQ
jgi:hypothetical protein